jgi:hypothetical protein
MRIKLFAIIVLFIFCNFTSYTQTLITALKQAVDTFDANYPQEKIFVHSDRSFYVANESIWFKVYCTLDGLPSILSKIVYIELVNEKNEIVDKKMFPLVNGTAHGDIYLKKDLPAGSYSLNGYTLWMLNFRDVLFKKPVRIFNTDTKATAAIPMDYQVHFLPEGGDLIHGVMSKIAFKALGNNGLPIAASGDILDNKNNKITTFQTTHDGMGSFEFTPIPGEVYKAVLATTDGNRKTIPLPVPKKEGIVLNVNNENGIRTFFQLQRGTHNSAAYNKILLVGRMNNTILYTTEINMDEGTTAGALSKKNLPSGILQLTAFSEAGTPLAERLVFINNITPPSLNLQIDSLNTASRKKNQFTIDLKGFKNISASLSVVNYSADSVDFNDNLITSLLLTSDIKGYVHNAAYYFKDKSEERAKHLDLLLLTQGWRNFNWTEIASRQYPLIQYLIESDITIRGKMTKPNGKQTLQAGRMDFITKTEDSITILSTIKIDGQEDFVLSGLDFKKSASIFYQGTNSKKENALVKVSLFPSYIDTLKRRWNDYSHMDDGTNANLQFTSYYNWLLNEKKAIEQAEGKLLSEVVLRSTRLSAADSLSNLYVSGHFMNSDQTIVTGKSNRWDIWRYLQMQITGISLSKNEAGETTVFMREPIQWRERVEFDISDPTTNIDFYLNEIKVSKEQIELLNGEDIVLIKVWKNVPAFTIGSEQSAIAFYTDKNKSALLWRSKGFDVFKKEGYSVSRNFYSLDYSLISPNTSFSDHRPTLYWNPNLPIDKAGKVRIEFYNDDVAKKFKVVIEGIDSEGKIISAQKILQ